MFPYADYEFYTERLNGVAEPDVFASEVLEASFFIQSLTMGKSDKCQPEALKYAVCKITDMFIQEKAKKSKGTGEIKSENTDGYSVTYAVEQSDGTIFEEMLNHKALIIAKKYLSNTGLLSRKVGCRHDHKCGLYNL